MSVPAMPDVYVASSLAAAVAALAQRGPASAPIAGGTWIMRAPLRQEPFKASYVALWGIPALREIVIGDKAVEIGACATHASVAGALGGLRGLEALATAAGKSGNPAVRGMATIGGNLATCDFTAADLVPALLALGAEVDIIGENGADRITLEGYLQSRSHPRSGQLLTKVVIPRSGVPSAHARLPLRKAGDYPVAVLSLAVTLDAASRVEAARIAVGSVEPVARRWAALEAALVGRTLDPAVTMSLASLHLDEFTGRDGIEAPGWYRVSVLPALMRRATASVLAAL